VSREVGGAKQACAGREGVTGQSVMWGRGSLVNGNRGNQEEEAKGEMERVMIIQRV